MTRQVAQCVTCGAELPAATGPAVVAGARHGQSRVGQARVGRPRRYCSQRCRQRAYRDRTDEAATPVPSAGNAPGAVPVTVAPDQVAVRRAWLADVADRVYQLECAVEDVRTALAEDATRAEMVTVCRNLLDSARSLRPALRRISSL
jgi:hypothetical protein